jgi:hypothetical protein
VQGLSKRLARPINHTREPVQEISTSADAKEVNTTNFLQNLMLFKGKHDRIASLGSLATLAASQ